MLPQLILLLFLCTIDVTAMEASAMSLLKGEKVCVASGFEGKVFLNGKPLAGAKVVRHFKWKDQEGEYEEVLTDEDGTFRLPTHWDFLKRVLPAQFIVTQEIFVHHEKESYQIWAAGKMTKGEYDEFNGKPSKFRCEVTDELQRVDLEVGFVGTNCRWETD